MAEEAPRSDATLSVVEEFEGDLFDAPDNAILIHACNCLGSWGAGIAKAFKMKYPMAYKVHNDFCKATPKDELIGTCQLIPPQPEDFSRTKVDGTSRRRSKRRKIEYGEIGGLGSHHESPDLTLQRHWIACLFTSIGYGKATKKHHGMDPRERILENTEKSLASLRGQLVQLTSNQERAAEGIDQKGTGCGMGSAPAALWSCKFNSGLFAVEWEDSRKILEEKMSGLGRVVRVVSIPKS